MNNLSVLREDYN